MYQAPSRREIASRQNQDPQGLQIAKRLRVKSQFARQFRRDDRQKRTVELAQHIGCEEDEESAHGSVLRRAPCPRKCGVGIALLLNLRDLKGRRSLLHHRLDALLHLVELRQFLASELLAARGLDAGGVHRAVIDADFVMEVRARRAAGRADVADDLALIDLGAAADARRRACSCARKAFRTCCCA